MKCPSCNEPECQQLLISFLCTNPNCGNYNKDYAQEKLERKISPQVPIHDEIFLDATMPINTYYWWKQTTTPYYWTFKNNVFWKIKSKIATHTHATYTDAITCTDTSTCQLTKFDYTIPKFWSNQDWDV